MNIIIFGATGFIGRNLTNRLMSKDHNVTVVSRDLSKVEEIFKGRVQKTKLDYDQTEKLSESITNNDIVINLAGENIASGLWTGKQKQKILNSRLKLGSVINKAITEAQKKPQLLIQASAIGYYGYETSPNCNEKSPKGKGFLAEVTEKWEKSTQQVENFGVKRIIIRTGVVLGKEEGILPKLITPIKLFVGSNFGKGKNLISWIHIEDEIRAIEFLISNKASEGIYNLTAPYPKTSKELNQKIGEILNRPIWLRIPVALIKFILGDMAKELLLADQKVFPNKLLNEGFDFKYPELDKALNSLL